VGRLDLSGTRLFLGFAFAGRGPIYGFSGRGIAMEQHLNTVAGTAAKAEEAAKPAHRAEECKPVADLLGRIGDKWTGIVLAALGTERVRFMELQRRVTGISQRMLTVTLRQLERDGLVHRTVHPTVPPRVEYQVSDLGQNLRNALEPVGQWAKSNLERIEEARRRFDDAADSTY